MHDTADPRHPGDDGSSDDGSSDGIDSCGYVDGECDEPPYSTLCAMGTDTTDCSRVRVAGG